MKKICSILFVIFFWVGFAAAQENRSQHTIYLECGALWDAKSEKLIPKVRIAVSLPDGKIAAVQRHRPGIGLGIGSGAIENVDLSKETCLPGLDMQDKVHTIEPGKVADIVAVPGDPLVDAHVLEKVDFVMNRGVIYKRP